MAKKKIPSSDSSGCWYIFIIILGIIYFFYRFPIVASISLIAIIAFFAIHARKKKAQLEIEQQKDTAPFSTCKEIEEINESMDEGYTKVTDREKEPLPMYVIPSFLKNETSSSNYGDVQNPIPSFVSLQKIETKDDKEIKKLDDYIVLDLETTGLSKTQDRVVEIGLIRVSGGEIVDEYSTLVNPEIHIPAEASRINGIYDSDVSSAPRYSDVAEKLADMLIGQTILGYNVTFDLAFIKNLFEECYISGDIKYFDVLYYAKRILPELRNHKLGTVSEYLNVPTKPEHRALDDAKATYFVFCECKRKFELKRKAEAEARKIERERIKKERAEKYKSSPLFDIAFAFTGVFSKDREEIEKLATSVGGFVREKVTSKTDYLVVGDIKDLPDWAIARKFGKAEQLRTEGKKVKNISEAEYLKLIEDAKAILKK